jgi:hypothetical protein
VVIAAAALLLAGLITAGVVAGGSGSGSTTGPTGATGQAAQNRTHSGSRHAAPHKPPKVAVPSVVGEQRDSALADLQASKLHGRFVAHGVNAVSLICADAAPTSNVVGQLPKANAQIHEGAHVSLAASSYVQTGCRPSTAARPCNPGELSLRVSEGKPDYTGGGEDTLVTVNVKHVRGRGACAVDSPIELAIDQPQGQPASRVEGNPGTLQLHTTLHVGELMVAGWVLGSWCGSRDGVVATASFAGISASQPLKQLPYAHQPCASLSLFELFRHGPGPG